MKISVIVPVYKSENYIEKFLDSFLEQTFKDFELILVDDGSPDKCPQICDDYAKKDNRITVIHQPNQGVSAARLSGFNVAQGIYFISCDPDDWVEPTYLEELWKGAEANDADIVYCAYDRVYEDRTEEVHDVIQPLDQVHYLKAQIAGGVWGVYWNKLIRTSIMKDNQIKPLIGVSVWEDFIVTIACALYAKKIVFCNKILYHYNQLNSNSITKSRSEKSYLDILNVVMAFSEEVKRAGLDDVLRVEVIRLKLFAKKYLLDSAYKDYSKWRTLFPECNSQALVYEHDAEKKCILNLVLNEHDISAYFLDFYFLYKEKVTRHLKKLKSSFF